METIDPQMAANVWNRVRGTAQQPSPEEGLLELIGREQEDAAIYQQLARRLQGRNSAIARKLYEQEQTHAACLKGIYTLITGSRPMLRTPSPAQGTPAQLLRLCYGREMHCLAQYERRSHDGAYGQVFARLAQQEQEHCHMVLALLGSLQE